MSQDNVVDIFEHKGMTFDIYEGRCDGNARSSGEEGYDAASEVVYYYWVADGVESPFNIPMVPSASVELAKLSAIGFVNGDDDVTEEDIATAKAFLERNYPEFMGKGN